MKVKDTATNFFEFLGFAGEELEEGGFVIELPFQPYLLQDDGTIHTGVFSTMLDIVLGASISKRFNSFATTINLNLSFLDVEPKTHYRGELTFIHKDGKYVTGEGVILDERNNLIAKGIGTFKIR